MSINNQNKTHSVEEIQIPVPWGHLSGKWWGPKDQQPILALHGWQDNCGTFDTMIALLPSDVAVLALDLPGHGHSSHFPIGQFYHVLWDGLLSLRRIVKYYKWTKAKLLGHSLGGAISFLYAASYPDEVEFLISIDIAGPSVKNITESAGITGVTVDRFLKYERLEFDSVPSYTYDEALQIVEDAYQGSITKESAAILMKRGTRPSSEPKRYCFSRDARLKVSLLSMPSMDLLLAYAAKITCAYLNIRASNGLKYDRPENYNEILDHIKIGAKRFEYHEVEGTHHVHLNNPERVAPLIAKFISTEH
ncbi:probable serine hydrolase isoform X1 [Colletes gigas]|uniref:probable serine hydrolase isoform X1 n=1 Tax=Colletes gigas TaxID=935657 RepID=UPI001C9B5609|nr:probable serine hydrolase isoform X1 [Colletes gigas]